MLKFPFPLQLTFSFAVVALHSHFPLPWK